MLEKCDLGSMVAQHPPFSRHATSTVRYFHQRNDMSPQKLGLWRNISISLIYRLVVHLDDSVPPGTTPVNSASARQCPTGNFSPTKYVSSIEAPNRWR